MKESWRWYGDLDKISLTDITQTGARGIVTALHDIPYGEVWPTEAIRARQAIISNDTGLGLHWNVVESLPIHEAIKRDDGSLSTLFANYRQSMANLAACGVQVICYNFMPLLDWTRTDLSAPVSGGGTTLKFSQVRMAAFEIHMLGRDGAESDYSDRVRADAEDWFQQASQADCDTLLRSIMAGLPGAYDRYDIDGLNQALERYRGIGGNELRANYARFLAEIIPTATDLGIRMCVHPDDPPRDILGLPRIVSDGEDIAWVLSQQDTAENGLTFCSGSLGANPENDVPAMARRFADRIHFAHLRNVAKESDGSFQEAAHLEGDTDMPALVQALLKEETRRRAEDRADWEIPFRPDHGHELLADIGRDCHPGYPLIGRMRGLAELRGVIAGLTYQS